MLTTIDQKPDSPSELIDSAAIAAELAAFAKSHTGNERELRVAVSKRLKTALVEGRATAERLLLEDRRGRRCAERLCFMQEDRKSVV
jgi:[protein-PII] uridylyltransferase